MRIFVPSCAKFSDSWNPFAQFALRFWPDRPFPFVLVTDRLTGDPWPFEQFQIGKDYGWCSNLLRALNEFPDEDPVCMVIMDDFWIDGQPNTEFILRAAERVRNNPSIGCFRLYPAPPANAAMDGKIGEVAKGTPYRICAAQAVWKKSFLRRLLWEHDTAWDFEQKGTKLAEEMPERVFSVAEDFRPMVCHYTAITRGEWEPSAIERARQLDIAVDTSRRPIRDP